MISENEDQILRKQHYIASHRLQIFTGEKDRLSKTISFFTHSGVKQIVATNEMQWSSCLDMEMDMNGFFWWFSMYTFQNGNSMFEEWMKIIEVCNIIKCAMSDVGFDRFGY